MRDRGLMLRWYLRRKCLAIAAAQQTDDGIEITLCNRWRFHDGECRGV